MAEGGRAADEGPSPGEDDVVVGRFEGGGGDTAQLGGDVGGGEMDRAPDRTAARLANVPLP